MAAPALSAVMAGIATQLATISGLRTSAFVPDQINPPAAWVDVPTVPNYHGAFHHGQVSLDFTVFVAVSATLDRIGQTNLAKYADPASTSSIHQAIEADRTLGGLTGCDCVVLSFRPNKVTVGAMTFYGGEFVLHVSIPGV